MQPKTFHLVIDTNSTNSYYPNTMPVAVLEITEEVLVQLQRARQQFRNASPHSGWFAPIRGVEIGPELFDAVSETDTSEEAQAWRNAFEDVQGRDPAFIVMTEPTPSMKDTSAELDVSGNLYYSERKGFWWRFPYDDADGVLETRAIKLSAIEATWQELNGSLPAITPTVADLFSEAAASILAAEKPERFTPEGIGDFDPLPSLIFAPITEALGRSYGEEIYTPAEQLIAWAEEALTLPAYTGITPEAMILYIAKEAIDRRRAAAEVPQA